MHIRQISYADLKLLNVKFQVGLEVLLNGVTMLNLEGKLSPSIRDFLW